MTTAAAKPWYRQFWFWFIAAPPILTVIASFYTLYLAGSPPALVVDDFGQIAMAVEKNQQRDHQAALLGLGATLAIDPRPGAGGQAVTVTLSGAQATGLRLALIHPTRSDLDQSTMLRREGDRYVGRITRRPGRLYLEVTDEAGAWRLTGVLAPDQQAVSLAAPPRR